MTHKTLVSETANLSCNSKSGCQLSALVRSPSSLKDDLGKRRGDVQSSVPSAGSGKLADFSSILQMRNKF